MVLGQRTLIAFGLPLLLAAAASAGDLHYSPEVVTLHGKLVRKPGEEPNGKRIMFDALRLDAPVTVQGTPGDAIDGTTERNVRELQIAIEHDKLRRSLRNKHVTVVGTLYHGHTGHHHTAVLIDAESVVQSAR